MGTGFYGEFDGRKKEKSVGEEYKGVRASSCTAASAPFQSGTAFQLVLLN